MQSYPENVKIAYSRKMGPISWLEMFHSYQSMSSVSSTELVQLEGNSEVSNESVGGSNPCLEYTEFADNWAEFVTLVSHWSRESLKSRSFPCRFERVIFLNFFQLSYSGKRCNNAGHNYFQNNWEFACKSKCKYTLVVDIQKQQIGEQYLAVLACLLNFIKVSEMWWFPDLLLCCSCLFRWLRRSLQGEYQLSF